MLLDLDKKLHAVTSIVDRDVLKPVERVVTLPFRMLPDEVTLQPKMPAYQAIPKAELAKAEARSTGATTQQRVIQNKEGNKCEPVVLKVAATQEELTALLEKQGWIKADHLTVWNSTKSSVSMLLKATGLSHLIDYNYQASPMTEMYIDGQLQAMAFNKNNDHHEARDHLRIFDSGKRDAKGRPVWEIAATRDVSLQVKIPSFGKGHTTDTAIDAERDLIMSDLLKGGVANWRVAQGKLSDADAPGVADTYTTDGKVYVVDL
ncbi:MAG: hypothetical protein JWM80_1021 [Cyanobacteria bacterium RYN_339]|nr:hypothetical protein [Cyanobacteria bacterium RYN_339]